MGLLMSAAVAVTGTPSSEAAAPRKILIAHRGASAYAPEHTAEAYELAIRQGADYIEPDLQMTRDGVFVCLHDPTLDRTTDVETRFPGRRATRVLGGEPVEGWFAADFTLEEIKSLDAGSWFDPRFSGSRIPTFEEVVRLAAGRSGVFPELKDPELYTGWTPSLAERFHAEALRLGLGSQQIPAMVQSFSRPLLEELRDLGNRLARIFLVGTGEGERWAQPEALREVLRFARGIGPARGILLDHPELVSQAARLGLLVIPYTFSSSRVTDRFGDVRAEMRYFLYDLGVDGLFTDNPDQFPRTAEETP
ncbi:MAG: glycerophosphodiester phosphodiesterase [Acidobacteriota bacterium]